MMILKQIDSRTISLQGNGVVAVVASAHAERWARLFANAEKMLRACEGLLAEVEFITTELDWEEENFPSLRAAREAVSAARHI